MLVESPEDVNITSKMIKFWRCNIDVSLSNVTDNQIHATLESLTKNYGKHDIAYTIQL